MTWEVTSLLVGDNSRRRSGGPQTLFPGAGCVPVDSRSLGGLAECVLALGAPPLPIGSRTLVVPPSPVRPLAGGQVSRGLSPVSRPVSSLWLCLCTSGTQPRLTPLDVLMRMSLRPGVGEAHSAASLYPLAQSRGAWTRHPVENHLSSARGV